MPCTCDGYPEPEPDTHNGPLAEALCKVLQEHEKRGEMGCFDKPTLEWWEEHKRRDAARVAEDLRRATKARKKAEALAKLTPYERRLLGLHAGGQGDE
jgi:hypothetical protein